MTGNTIPIPTPTEQIPLTVQERGCLIAALDLSRVACDAAGHPLDPQLVDELRAKLQPQPDLHAYGIREVHQPRCSLARAYELTKPQELAADAMAAKHGRSAVEPNADGSVVITGLLDDVVRERVCIEVDGRERWRS